MNSCSTKVKFDELCEIMRNQNMKYIAANSINSSYGRSHTIVLFDEDKIRKRNIKHHMLGHEKKSKK